MKTLIPALALAALIAVPAFAQSAAAAPKARRDFDQSQVRRDSDQSRTRRDSNGSWQCYPYCDGGTYEGRPVREWLRPGRW
jgi:hypothetical protein